jgi:hypothetical protein
VTDARETLKIGRIKSKKGWIIRCFDHQRVLEINHDISFYLPFRPAALRMAFPLLRGTIYVFRNCENLGLKTISAGPRAAAFSSTRNPIFRFFGPGGDISSRMASNTTLN